MKEREKEQKEKRKRKEQRTRDGEEKKREAKEVLRGNQPRVDLYATPQNDVVMEAFAKLRASQLLYFEPALLDAVLPLHTLHHDHAVGNALQLQIAAFRGAIIE